MTPEQLDEAITRGNPDRCFDMIMAATEEERRKCAKTAARRIRRADDDIGIGNWIKLQKRREAAEVAVVGTATLAELKKIRGSAGFAIKFAYDILVKRWPDWLNGWTEWTLEQGVLPEWSQDGANNWKVVRRMIKEGICPRPETDSYIVGMIYAQDWTKPPRGLLWTDPTLLDHEVWRLFEVEGAAKNSLAAFDHLGKYSWKDTLIEFCREGRLDRQRLLTASLDALQRGFHPYRATWFYRFHEDLKPSLQEMAARADAYLVLVASSTPAIASFALNAVGELDKAGLIPPEALLDRLGPVLTAREKGSAVAALRLIDRAAAREKSLCDRACLIASEALGHSSADVQSRALNLIRKRGNPDDPVLRQALVEHESGIASSLRGQFSELSRSSPEIPEPAPAPPPQSDDQLTNRVAALNPKWSEVAGVLDALAALQCGELPGKAVRFGPMDIPRLDPHKAIRAIEDVDELIDVFTRIIENNGPPDDQERVLDAVSRLCHQRPQDFERRTGPLRKRVRAYLALDTPFAGRAFFHNSAYQWLALAWIDGELATMPRSDSGLGAFINARVIEVVRRAVRKEPATLLSAPTHSGGWIDPRIAVKRMLRMQGRAPVEQPTPQPAPRRSIGILERMKGVLTGELTVKQQLQELIPVAPHRFDELQCILRLAPDHRRQALAKAQDLTGELGAAVRYALGGDAPQIGHNAALWIAASRSRNPDGDDELVEARHGRLGPGAGRAARVTLSWDSHKRARHPMNYCCTPVSTNPFPVDIPTTHHYDWQRGVYGPSFYMLGISQDLLQIWPPGRSAWFINGLGSMATNLEGGDANRSDPAYLELAADPEFSLTPEAVSMIAFGLAAPVPEQTGTATDVLIAAISDGRISGKELGAGLISVLGAPRLVYARWARSLSDAARVSPLHALTVREGLEVLFEASPSGRLSDFVQILELEHELCVQTGIAITGPAARSWLQSLQGSGKAAKLARSLLQQQSQPDARQIGEASRSALEARLERAERWQRIAGDS